MASRPGDPFDVRRGIVSGEETVNERLGQIGGVSTDRAPGLTIRPARPPSSGQRELPSISIDLRGALDGPRAEDHSRPADTRDLEVLRTLGEGGMARVFLARQHSLDRDVAIKTIREQATDVERSALLSEGAITGYLEHPAVVPVHALGVDGDGRPALVMKWVEGSTWSDRLAEPDVSLEAHLEILMQVCNAVHFAHSRGILHRDIKPENVLLGRYGEVYLADWGIALRLDPKTDVQPLCGTPSYMAPEMVVGGLLSPRTDVYLLGATLHRVLAGSPRHVATNVRATLVCAMESAPFEYSSTVPAPLAALANRATSFDPEARPATAAELRQEIADYISHKGSIALAASALERIAKLRLRVEESAAHAEIDVLAAEARFAIDEARRGWPENPEAAAAESALEELLAARRTRAAELERLARELDPGISRRQRMIALVAMAGVALTLSVSAFASDRRGVDTAAIFRESIGPLVAVVGLLALLRRSLLATELNRRANLCLLVIVAGITVHRGLALIAGTPAPQVLASDCFFIAMIAAAGAIAVFRWLVAVSVIMLLSAFWAAVAPNDAMRAFSAGVGASILACVFFTARAPSSSPR